MEEQLPVVDTHMVTTAFTLDGYKIDRNLGLVRGIIVRSRSIFGTVGASLQTLVGGDITLFTKLCEETRAHAYQRMSEHAAQMGANAIIGVRYDATEIMQGVTEVLCYGTAVIARKSEYSLRFRFSFLVSRFSFLPWIGREKQRETKNEKRETVV